VAAGGPERAVINRRVAAWRFCYAGEQERRMHAAVRAAAAFMTERRDSFPEGRAPRTPMGIAVVAVKAFEVFMDPAVAGGLAGDLGSERARVLAERVMQRAREFDSAPASASAPPPSAAPAH
jgi:uncharacterized protein